MSSSNIFLAIKPSSERFQKKFESILNFSKSNFITDFKVEVISTPNSANRKTINVNKNVLACGSSYFLEKFRENPALNKIEINGIRYESVNKIFDYLYSDSIIINKNDLNDIIRLAKIFQLDKVLEAVFAYIEDNLDVENVLNIRDLYLSFNQMEKVVNCDKFIENNFDEVSKTETFKRVEFIYLDHLIKSDELVVEDEKRIFEIVVEWINVDIQRRQQYGQQLLENVKFPLMAYDHLHTLSDNEIIESKTLFKKIIESIHYLKNKEFRMGQNILKTIDVTARKYKNVLANEEELKEYLICIGGSNALNSIEICADFGSIWNTYDKIDPGRCLFTSCTYENFIILIGGVGAEQLCTKYDAKNKIFTNLEPLPCERKQHVATIINSELFVFGGCTTSTIKSLISLNLNEQNGKWTNRKSSLEKRNGSTGCSVKGKFYVFGGYQSNSCEYYCPQADIWRPLPKMKEERWFAGSCYDNNKFIYVVGGKDIRNNICHTSMERFDVEISQWLTLKSSIGVGRRGLTLTIFKNQLILIGGQDKDFKCHKTIQKYDSILDSWSTIGNLNVARTHHCTVNVKF